MTAGAALTARLGVPKGLRSKSLETYGPRSRRGASLRPTPSGEQLEVDSRVKWGMTVAVIFEALENK
jgi:hypothetical protein